MSLKNLFKKMSSKKIAGVAIAAGGGALVVIDAFRLAHGDVSVLGGASFSAAFATHAGLISTGLSLIPASEKEAPTVIVQGFNPNYA